MGVHEKNEREKNGTWIYMQGVQAAAGERGMM